MTFRHHLLVIALGVGAGCASRQHLTPTYGESSRGFFQAQRADPHAGERPKPTAALDSEDAKAVSATYRDSMAPKGRPAPYDSNRLILVAPPSNNPAPAMPPPSVPTAAQ